MIDNRIKRIVTSLTAKEVLELAKVLESAIYRCEYDMLQEASKLHIFKNGINRKKCVFVSTARLVTGIIRDAISAASDNLHTPEFTERLDVYCTTDISADNQIRLKKEAAEKYIELTFYTPSVLAEMNEPALDEWFSVNYADDAEDNLIEVDDITKVLYRLVASGKDSTDLKASIINSAIVFSIFENENAIDRTSLKKEVERKLRCEVPTFDAAFNQLAMRQDIRKVDNNNAKYCLSDEVYLRVKQAHHDADIAEHNFNEGVRSLFEKYSVSNRENCIEMLQQLYQQHYTFTETLQTKAKTEITFDQFSEFVRKQMSEPDDVDKLMSEIRQLCSDNPYLDHVTVSSSFITLYGNNKLSEYVNDRQKCVMLDTPPLVYYICHLILNTSSASDWDNPAYIAMKSFVKLAKSKPNEIVLCTIEDYVNEVIGEYKKALQLSSFEGRADESLLGQTRNTFFNYYQFLKQNIELFEHDCEITDFRSFAKNCLMFRNTDIDSTNFDQDIKKHIYGILKHEKVTVLHRTFDYDLFENQKKVFAGKLEIGYDRSPEAIASDTRALLILGGDHDIEGLKMRDNEYDRYMATWDQHLFEYRKYLNQQPEHVMFGIHTPAKLVSKIGLEDFNIDASCISCNILVYANTTYDFRNKLKTFIDSLMPLISSKGSPNLRLYDTLDTFKKDQLYNDTATVDEYDVDRKKMKENDVEDYILDTLRYMNANLGANTYLTLFAENTINMQFSKLLQSCYQDIVGGTNKDTSFKKLCNQVENLVLSMAAQPTDQEIVLQFDI